MYVVIESSELLLTDQLPVELRQREKSARPSPSKSNETVPAAGITEAGAEAVSVFFAPMPKKIAIDEARADTGEIGFARSKPSGTCGVLKNPRTDAPADETVETIFKSKVEPLLGNTYACGGTEIGAGDGGRKERGCAAVFQTGLKKKTGASSEMVRNKAAARLVRLTPHERRKHLLANRQIKNPAKNNRALIFIAAPQLKYK